MMHFDGLGLVLVILLSFLAYGVGRLHGRAMYLVRVGQRHLSNDAETIARARNRADRRLRGTQ